MQACNCIVRYARPQLRMSLRASPQTGVAIRTPRCGAIHLLAIRFFLSQPLVEGSTLSCLRRVPFPRVKKEPKDAFFTSGLQSVGCRGRSCHPENAAPPLVCTRFGASARRDDMRASPGSCTPGDASSVPAVVVGSPSGGIYAAPTECVLAG